MKVLFLFMMVLVSFKSFSSDSLETKTFKAEFNETITKVVEAPLKVRNDTITIDPNSDDCSHTNGMIKVTFEERSWCESKESIKKSYGVKIYE